MKFRLMRSEFIMLSHAIVGKTQGGLSCQVTLNLVEVIVKLQYAQICVLIVSAKPSYSSINAMMAEFKPGFPKYLLN